MFYVIIFACGVAETLCCARHITSNTSQVVTASNRRKPRVQVKWMYLGPVYGSEEIAKQMPKERKEFTMADGKYRRIMAATQKNPDVQLICGMDGLLEDLIEANKVRTRSRSSLVINNLAANEKSVAHV